MNLPVWKNLFRIKRAEEEIVPPLPNVEREFVLRCGPEGEATSRATPESISRAILSAVEGETVTLSDTQKAESEDERCACVFFHITDGEKIAGVILDSQFGGRVLTKKCKSFAEVVSVFRTFFEQKDFGGFEGWEQGDLLSGEEFSSPKLPPCALIVDYDNKFKNIDFDDVRVSLESLAKGEIECILLGRDGLGYIEVSGNDGEYSVEIAGSDEEGEWVTFTTKTIYSGHVNWWVSNFFDRNEFPHITADWQDISKRKIKEFEKFEKKIVKGKGDEI